MKLRYTIPVLLFAFYTGGKSVKAASSYPEDSPSRISITDYDPDAMQRAVNKKITLLEEQSCLDEFIEGFVNAARDHVKQKLYSDAFRIGRESRPGNDKYFVPTDELSDHKNWHRAIEIVCGTFSKEDMGWKVEYVEKWACGYEHGIGGSDFGGPKAERHFISSQSWRRWLIEHIQEYEKRANP